MTLLELKKVSVAYSESAILRDISLDLESGEWLMVVGPNGAGKSTLIRAVSGIAPYTGDVIICGKDRKEMRSKEIALCIGTLSQSHNVGYSFSVRDLVGLGRYPYRKGIMSGKNENDEQMVETAIREVGLAELADRSLLTLSGGELQRAFLAQLFAQDPQVLLLDEPTNNLDLVYQKEVFDLLRNWVSGKDRAILSVVHDLGLVRAYGSKALLLDKGETAAYGYTEEVFSDDNVNDIYRLDVRQWMKKLYSPWISD
jgi:iron complex transport system ATP-binding protein